MLTFEKVKKFVHRYERHLSVAAMAVGFLLDGRALHRVDLPFETFLLYFYFAAAALIIVGIHLAEEGRWKGKLTEYIRPWLPIAFQFIAGSWMSAYLVFYSRSASLGASWPFLFVVFAVFVGTEIFKKYSDKLVFQSGIFFFAVFSFFVFTVPLWVGAIGTSVFLLSGAAALLVCSFLYVLLFWGGPKRFVPTARKIVRTTVAIYVAMNVLYFSHLLPPLPLTLTDIGVYHSLVKQNDGYHVSGEEHSWLSTIFGDTTEHVVPGATLYVFSSVFDPVAIKTDVVHHWEYFDTAQKKWITKSTVRFPVSGGRDGGYRGYSAVEDIAEGKWRVSVETPDGALIGRIEFTAAYVAIPAGLVQSVL